MKSYIGLLFLALLLICSTGTLLSGDTPWHIVWMGFKQRIIGESTHWNPLLDERLPRLIILMCTGSAWAISGVVMQALFQNPLASPSVLGISTGGSLFVVFVFIFNWHLWHPYLLPLAAVLGCFLTLCLVYMLSRMQEGTQISNLILTGIAISTIFISAQGVLLYALREQWQLVQTITEWEAGSTHNKSWQHVHMQLPLTLVGLLGCWVYKREMNILALGEEEAKNLGVDVQRIRWRLFLCVSLLIGGALAAVGMIAFFGLVLPHILRLLRGPNHQELIPLCLIAGAATLMAIDLCLRVFHIYSISIGNFSAIVGGFFFIVLLFKTGQQRARIV